MDKTKFYQHDQNWANRMILGDSLQVMASLAEREGLRGKVQCIYVDPPYGIRFNSNFRWSTTSRDVKDGNAGHITGEPEQVKAFRDTWRDGIHSYLTYLRDRLTVARDALAESGSIFVQIGDENLHRVRAVMEEVFDADNPGLFFAGDLGQRIFQVPFSWRSLGVDIRGRSATLRINYRTSHQIRSQADRLLGKQITDVDGNTEDRRATISVFNGPVPLLRVVGSAEEESGVVGRWLAERAAEGVAAGEMAVFVRSAAELPRARAAVEGAGLPFSILDDGVKTVRDRVPVGTMHLSLRR